MHILVINPGGGSTKVAVFAGVRPVLRAAVAHSPRQLSRYRHVLDQYPMRKAAVLTVLESHGCDISQLDAIATRGGPLLPLPGGVYRITGRLVNDIRAGRYQTLHPSVLGPLIGHELGLELSVPAYFVDPESTDEFWEPARLSGLAGVTRAALSHALSCRSVAQAAARLLGRPYNRCRFVVAHLGTGITVACHRDGRQVDATNANEEGPFSPQRTGSLPSGAVVRLCFSGRYTEQEITDLLQRRGGVLSYIKTDDVRQLGRMAAVGNKFARSVYEAMVYQIAKEIGAYRICCGERLDGIVLTGGLTLSARLVRDLRRWLRPLGARIFVFPGEVEMTALATRVLGVLRGTEKELSYEQEVALGR